MSTYSQMGSVVDDGCISGATVRPDHLLAILQEMGVETVVLCGRYIHNPCCRQVDKLWRSGSTVDSSVFANKRIDG